MSKRLISDTVTKSKTVEHADGTVSEETHTQERIIAYQESEPEFIKIYVKTICFVKNISTASTDILFALLQRMSYADERYPLTIIVNSFVKESIAHETGKSVKSVERAISDFLKSKILFRIGGERSGTYQANAEMFGKGHWKDIMKLRKEQLEKFNAKIDFLTGDVTAEIQPKDNEME